jgi:hypothetical protein
MDIEAFMLKNLDAALVIKRSQEIAASILLKVVTAERCLYVCNGRYDLSGAA